MRPTSPDSGANPAAKPATTPGAEPAANPFVEPGAESGAESGANGVRLATSAGAGTAAPPVTAGAGALPAGAAWVALAEIDRIGLPTVFAKAARHALAYLNTDRVDEKAA